MTSIGGTQVSDLSAGMHLELIATLGGLKSSVDRLAALQTEWVAMEKARQYDPRPMSILGNGSTDSSGHDLVIDCGGPPQGYYWELRALYISGPLPTSTVAGAAYFSDSPTAPVAGNLSSMNAFDQATSIPQAAFYIGRQGVVVAPSKLWCVIHGGTAATQYIVSGLTDEILDRSALQVVAI